MVDMFHFPRKIQPFLPDHLVSSIRFWPLFHVFVTFLLIAVLQFPFSPAHANQSGPKVEKTEYTFGVFPFLAQRRLEEIFAPIAHALSQSLGKPVSYRSSKNFLTFMDVLKSQRLDIAFVQPFDYVRIAAPLGYRPMVSSGAMLSALIMVKVESPVHTLQDLRGKTIALPPAVAAVSYLTRLTLEDHGLIPDRDYAIKHVRSHDACLHLLLIETVQACGSAKGPIMVFEKKFWVKFRLLKASSAIPPPLFVIHPRVLKEDRLVIQHTLLSLKLSTGGRALFLGGTVLSLWPVTHADYGMVQRYWERIQKEKAQTLIKD